MHQKYDIEYIFARQPELIVFNSHQKPQPDQWITGGYWEGEDALLDDLRLQIKYVPIAKYWSRKMANGDAAYILLVTAKTKPDRKTK